MEYKRADTGLYYYDIHTFDKHEHKINNKEFKLLRSSKSSFIQTVEETKSLISNKEIQRADLVRTIQELLGWPSTNDFKKIVTHNLVKNCPLMWMTSIGGLNSMGNQYLT